MSTTEEAKADKEEFTLDEYMPGYLGDTEVSQTRAPEVRILRPEQLMAWEKCRLNDLAEAWLGVKLQFKRKEVTLTLESRNELLQVVFEYWHTGSTQGTAKPTLRRGKIREASFHAGEWSKDLSLEAEDSDEDSRGGSENGGEKSPNNKRKREEECDKEEPAQKLTKRQESRL
ncbi:hypothetical protein B0J15DRAFT_522102 [Fusarium solani]|jgi:hypothetical protein|uniref:Uncharacterized protein n=1 Tax=Fusarium solani TaxID=169388 RepID=A0A9P9KZ83_FUSSL|nr:uncharacterized protein B0J15DRAFT_522102 [Fusarium solani]KAH7271055.1 hypothetical protein B0J15DRAFT_522102 [Fusarium solani]